MRFAFCNWFFCSGNVCSTDVMLVFHFLHALIYWVQSGHFGFLVLCKAGALLFAAVLCLFFCMQTGALLLATASLLRKCLLNRRYASSLLFTCAYGMQSGRFGFCFQCILMRRHQRCVFFCGSIFNRQAASLVRDRTWWRQSGGVASNR